jgi:hypothetical protein
MVDLSAPDFGGVNAGRARSGLSQYSNGTSAYDIPGNSAMLAILGRSTSAIWFSNPTYTGFGGMTPRRFPSYPDRQTNEMIISASRTADQWSYYHPIREPLRAWPTRDALTEASLANSPPLPDEIDTSNTAAETPTQRLAAELETTRLRYLADGWRYLKLFQLGKKGDSLLQSRSCFESARMLQRDDAEALAGKLLCATADREMASATVYLTLLRNVHPNLFDLPYRLDNVFAGEREAEAIVATLGAMSSGTPNDDAVAALHVWFLWTDGQANAAMAAANRLRDNNRSSPFASFVEEIRVQMEAAADKPPPAP